MQAVFITGANGYVGRHVAHEFVSRGYAVAGLVRSKAAAKVVMDLGASPVLGDLELPHTYQAAALAADVIVHAGFSYTDTGEERSVVDAKATAALLDFAASDGNARHLIYTTSVFRYGTREDGYASELNAVPIDPADWRHAVAEQVLTRATQSLRTSVIRLGWVFGSQGSTLGEAISPLAGKKLPTDLSANRIPLIEVADLARLYVDVSAGKGGVFHGCSGQPLTVGELANIATELNAQLKPRDHGHEEHFAAIFGKNTPAISVYRPSDIDLGPRVKAALQTEREQALAR